MEENNKLLREKNAEAPCHVGMKKYAEVLKQNKVNEVIMVVPKNSQDSLFTKNKIRSKVDPSGFNVSRFREAKNGAFIIGCDTKEGISSLRTQLAILGEKYSIETPSLKKPKLKIVNINKHDVSLEDSDETIIDNIKSFNSLNSIDDFHMKILKRSINRFKNIDLILEMDPMSHNLLLKQEKVKVGWSRCPAFNHVSILQCYNCYGFGHFAKDCKSNKVCSQCSEYHSYKDCKAPLLKCVNCQSAAQENHVNIDVNHSALDKNCPCLLKVIKSVNLKINYFCES